MQAETFFFFFLGSKVVVSRYWVCFPCSQALEKFKYEQSLESVRHFIAIAEKELELYYRHIALYGDPNDRNPLSILDSPTEETKESGNLKILGKQKLDSTSDFFSAGLSGTEADSSNSELSETDGSEHDNLSLSESDSEDDKIYSSDDEACTSKTQLFDFKHERLERRRENLIWIFILFFLFYFLLIFGAH